jgi:hypothetical protein
MTPIFMGSGYGAGAYFFWRTFRSQAWHPASVLYRHMSGAATGGRA